MSLAPVEPWVHWTRKAILWIGFGRPLVAADTNSSGGRDGTFALIGALFVAMMFMPVALVTALFLSTYKLRFLVVPPVLVAAFWWVSSQSATYNGFNLPPYMILWIITFTAATLLLPQGTAIDMIFRRKPNS